MIRFTLPQRYAHCKSNVAEKDTRGPGHKLGGDYLTFEITPQLCCLKYQPRFAVAPRHFDSSAMTSCTIVLLQHSK